MTGANYSIPDFESSPHIHTTIPQLMQVNFVHKRKTTSYSKHAAFFLSKANSKYVWYTLKGTSGFATTHVVVLVRQPITY